MPHRSKKAADVGRLLAEGAKLGKRQPKLPRTYSEFLRSYRVYLDTRRQIEKAERGIQRAACTLDE